MDAEDLQDLYNTLRGSRSALAVLDARGLYLEKQFQRAHAKLLEAHATYQESRIRLLKQNAETQYAGDKDAERQIRRLKRKQEKAREILDVFADLLGQLDRRARREKERQTQSTTEPERTEQTEPGKQQPKTEPAESTPAESTPAESTPAEELAPAGQSARQPTATSESQSEASEPGGERLNIARPASVSEKFLDEFQENYGDDKLDVIGRAYAFLPVQSEDEIFGDALYFISKGDESYLVFTPASEQIGDTVTLTNVVSRKQLSPIPRETFVRLGIQRKMVLLLDKDNPILRQQEDTQQQDSGDKLDRKSESSKLERQSESEQAASDIEPEKQILDMGAFSQLMDAAQRSGLVPGADQIAHVRDREFRKGNYDLALQAIEGLYAKFSANSAARSQRLRKEEADISAGRIKISPKDLQAKRARDRAQDQAVERARSRFNRVLDGLRMLIKSS